MMTARLYLWITILATGVLLSFGCASSGSPKGKQGISPTKAAASPRAKSNSPVSEEPSSEKLADSYAHFATAVAYDLDGKSDLALEEFQKASDANPYYEPLALEVARRLIRIKDNDKAIEVLKRVANGHGATGSTYAWLGLAYNQAGQQSLAIAANQTAIKKMPQSLPPYQNLVQIYLTANKTNDAMAVLDLAAKQTSVAPEFLADLADLYSRYGRLDATKGTATNKRIKELLDRAAELNPTNPLTLQKIGDAYFQIDELKSAEQAYVKLLDDYPDMPVIRAKLAEIYLRTDQKGKVSEQLEAIARLDPTNPKTQSFLGAIALEENKLNEASEYFERALLLSPDLEPIYYDLAGIKINLRKPDQAMAVLDKARAKFKPNFLLDFYTAFAQVQLTNYPAAVKYFTSAEVLGKAQEPSRLTHNFYFEFGGALEQNGQIDEAEKAFKKAIDIFPDFAEAMNYLGYMWTDRGIKLDEARDLIERAVVLDPKNPAFLDSFAWVLYKLKRPQEALDWMLKAVANSEKSDETLYDHLGDIYAALKQMDKAEDAWRKSLSVKPDSAIQKKLDQASSVRSSNP